MSPEKKSFVNVDELMPRVSLEQVAVYYGAALPELHRVGSETRARCFLNCGKTSETGDRALAIQHDHPVKQFQCHQYGCGKNGNLVSICDLLKPGTNAGGRPRGERFKKIAKDLLSMTDGGTGPAAAAEARPAPPPEPVKLNIPLRDSPNERARTLTELDQKFVVDVADMSPKASAYIRRRPFLSPEEMRAWCVGFLPRDTGEDNSGGTMRGRIVYPYLSESGDVLTWFGRDPDFEDKHKAWTTSDRSEREPEKFHFVKGFHRGIELFGQDRLKAVGLGKKLTGLGLPLVEGPNDVIWLSTIEIPALGLCSNTITREQAVKVTRLAREIAGGIVSVFLDCDTEGANGMKQCLGYLAQLTAVRLAWTSKMYAGRFKGRQPESLTAPEWEEIRNYLKTGKTGGWSLG